MMRARIITYKRARGLRRTLSLPEAILWTQLRGARFRGLRFRRQHPLGVYILDFYCAEIRLAVEVDGEGHSHPDQARHDEARDRWLANQGVRVMRIPAPAVLDDYALDHVLDDIARLAASVPPP